MKTGIRKDDISDTLNLAITDEANKRVSGIFAKAGTDYGYGTVTAEFEEFNDMKLKWSHTAVSAHFGVSDYFLDAPDKVFEDMARFVLSKITGRPTSYPDSLREYVTRPDFAPAHSGDFIRRSGIIEGPGDHVDLKDSLMRLHGLGLIEHPDSLDIRWGWISDAKSPDGASHVLMRVISLPTSLDKEDVDEGCLDWQVYNLLANILVGFIPEAAAHKAAIEEFLDRYPFDLRVKAEAVHMKDCQTRLTKVEDE